jgi:tetratricopeptide (TPR) repeat protein
MKKNNVYLNIIIMLLIVVCLAAFGPIAGNDFINFDDQGYVTENYQIQQGINFQTLKWALTTTYFSYWHPLTWLSHALDWSLFGANASGHHLVSLLLHIGAVIFLFLFLNKTTNNIWPSAFAAAFFALHPLRVESVAWVSERKDVLSMFFAMACFLAYAFYAQKAKISLYFLCLILFALALMSKPTMVTLPFVLMLLDYWPLNRWQKALDGQDKGVHSVGGLIGEKIPFICMVIAVSILTFLAQNEKGTVASVETISFMSRTYNAVLSYAAYLGKTAWPFNLAVFYPYELPLPLWKIIISGIIIAVITMAALYYIKKLPFLFAGWFIYLGTLIPVIGLVQVGSQAMADRYTYMPSIGIAFMLAWGFPYMAGSENIRKKVLFPAGVAVIIFLSVLTWRQCGYWKNSIVLFNHTLSVTRDNPLVHNQLGLAYFEKSKNEKALYHYNKAIIQQPVYDNAYNNRGAVYLKFGRYQQALNDFNKTIVLNPFYTQAYNNRASILAQSGQYNLAIEDLGKAIQINPAYVLAYSNRGFLFAKVGYYQKAIDDFNKVIRLKPDDINSYKNRSFVYFKQGKNVLGCQDAKKVCELGNCSILELTKKNGLCR